MNIITDRDTVHQQANNVTSNKRLFDPQEVQRAYSLLFSPGQVVELRVLEGTTSSDRYTSTYSGYFDNIRSLTGTLSQFRSALGFYVTLQECNPELLNRAENKLRRVKSDKDKSTSDKDIMRYNWLLIDCDPDRVAGISSTEEEHTRAFELCQKVREALTALGWSAPILGDSGNGWHLLYKIDLSPEDADLVKRVLVALGEQFDTENIHIDRSVFNPARICKLYGTLACKGSNTTRRPHRMARIVEAPEHLEICSREQLEAIAAAQPELLPTSAPRTLGTQPTPANTPQDKEQSQAKLQAYLDKQKVNYELKEDKFILTDGCVFDDSHQAPEAAVLVKLIKGEWKWCYHCFHDSCSAKTWKDFRLKIEPDAYTKKSNLPAIYIGEQLRETTACAIDALAQKEQHRPNLFLQQGKFKRVGRDEMQRPTIFEVGEAELRNALTHSANYFRKKKDEKTEEGFTEIAVSPPKDVVQSILGSIPSELPFPALETIVQTPVIRSNGTILDQPGYDPETHLYYIPEHQLHIPAIPMTPTKEQAKEAMTFLSGLIQDFPWESPADRANALGLMLTIVTRHMFKHVPMALVDATKQGTGKGLFTDIINILTTGKGAAALSPGTNDEELDKRITAMLISGETVITIDNIEGVLRSPVLAKILTSEYHKGRVLGASKMVNVPQRAIWIANGNNLQVGGDLARRCYRMRMISQISEPDSREGFQYPDLDGFVNKNRGAILCALLTIARAWFVAGSPLPAKKLRKLGTFTKWSATIGGMLSFVDVESFLENVSKLRKEADIDSAAWSTFLETWLDVWGSTPYKATQIIEKITDPQSKIIEILPEPLADLFSAKEDKSLSRKVGRLLAKQDGTPYGPQNLRIVKGEDTHSKVATFKVAGYCVDPSDDLSSKAGYAGSSTPAYGEKAKNEKKLINPQRDGSNASLEKHIGPEVNPTPHTTQTPQSELEPEKANHQYPAKREPQKSDQVHREIITAHLASIEQTIQHDPRALVDWPRVNGDEIYKPGKITLAECRRRVNAAIDAGDDLNVTIAVLRRIKKQVEEEER